MRIWGRSTGSSGGYACLPEKDGSFFYALASAVRKSAGNELQVGAMKRCSEGPESTVCAGDRADDGDDGDGLSKSSSLLQCEIVCRSFEGDLVIGTRISIEPI